VRKDTVTVFRKFVHGNPDVADRLISFIILRFSSLEKIKKEERWRFSWIDRSIVREARVHCPIEHSQKGVFLHCLSKKLRLESPRMCLEDIDTRANKRTNDREAEISLEPFVARWKSVRDSPKRIFRERESSKKSIFAVLSRVEPTYRTNGEASLFSL